MGTGDRAHPLQLAVQVVRRRVDRELPDPTARILVYCQIGRISTLATATLRQMGYARTVALDGGYETWCAAGFPTEVGA